MDINSLAHTKWNCKYHIVIWLRKFTLGNNSVESPRCTDKV